MHLRLQLKRYHEFFWLRDIQQVNIYECCAKCFIGGRDSRVYYGTLRQSRALIDIDVIENPKAVAYYLCGLSAGYNWWQNTHVAFIPAPGEMVEIENNNISLKITDARRIEFEGYKPNPPGFFTNRQRRCRNWIFANFINDGMLRRITNGDAADH